MFSRTSSCPRPPNEAAQTRCKRACVCCCYVKGPTWVAVEIHGVQRETCPLLSLAECEPRCHCRPPGPSSSSVLIQGHRQIYLHLFLLKCRSHNCPSCSGRSLSSTSTPLKNFNHRSGRQRESRLPVSEEAFPLACASDKEAAEAIVTRKRCRRAQLNETQSAG